MREEEFCREILQRRLIEAELPLQQPVGPPFAATQQLDHSIEYLVQVHAQPLRCRVVVALSHPAKSGGGSHLCTVLRQSRPTGQRPWRTPCLLGSGSRARSQTPPSPDAALPR